MSLSTFGTFTQARLGIYASQAGLSITGNNIANINTDGYTRQKLNQSSFYAGGADRYYSSSDINIGNGVLCTGTSQFRDPYLDLRYRGEMSSFGSADAKLAALENIQRVLDETGDGEDGFGVLGAQLSDFFKQLQNLNEQTGLEAYDIQVRSSASALAKLFNTYSNQLREVHLNAEKELDQDVTVVNNILTRIRELNNDIRKADLHNDSALELRDEREVLIDQLSNYMKIDVVYGTEEIAGGTSVEKLSIRLGNANPDNASPNDQATLVEGIYCTQLSIPKECKDPHGNTVPNEHKLVLLDALKDPQKRVKIGSTELQLADNDLYGSLQSQRESLTEAGEYTTDDVLMLDPKAATKRGIPYYQKTLDLLAKQFADTINQANQGFVRNPKGEYVKKDGTAIKKDGKIITTADEMTPELEQFLHDNGGQLIGTPLFSSEGNKNNPEGITAGNISISKSWSLGPQVVRSFVQIGSKGPESGIGSTDSSNITHMLSLMNADMKYYAKESDKADDSYMFKGTFNQMWTNIGTVLGNDMMITGTMLDAYESSSVQLDMNRDGVSSVDLNDEAMNLMQYSKSYSAACRLMTTVDSILEKLIDGTGVTR